MYIRDLIIKKKDNKELNDEEIEFFIKSYYKNEIQESQAAALLMAFNIYGISDLEMASFVRAIVATGDKFNINQISKKLLDIHTIGGMSDKIVLILISILDSLGIPVAKVINRELGLEDRLLSIAGYKIESDLLKLKESIENSNSIIIKDNKNVAVIENRLYTLRHEIACDNDMALVAISLMSRKIALGYNNIFFEITYGKNAYAKDIREAKRLAKHLVKLGDIFNKKVGCCITKLDEPIGRFFGNSLEIKEVYEILKGNMTDDVKEIINEFGFDILGIWGITQDRDRAEEIIFSNIKDRRALNSFERLIKLNGGNLKTVKEEREAKFKIPVVSDKNGYVQAIDVNKVRMLALELDVIRSSPMDSLDIGAGFEFVKKIGDSVKKDDILGYIYTNDKDKIKNLDERLLEAYDITEKKVKKQERVVVEVY